MSWIKILPENEDKEKALDFLYSSVLEGLENIKEHPDVYLEFMNFVSDRLSSLRSLKRKFKEEEAVNEVEITISFLLSINGSSAFTLEGKVKEIVNEETGEKEDVDFISEVFPILYVGEDKDEDIGKIRLRVMSFTFSAEKEAEELYKQGRSFIDEVRYRLSSLEKEKRCVEVFKEEKEEEIKELPKENNEEEIEKEEMEELPEENDKEEKEEEIEGEGE